MARVRLAEDRIERGPLLAFLAVVIVAGAVLAAWAGLLDVRFRAGRTAATPAAIPATIAEVRQLPIQVERPGQHEQARAREALARWRWVDEARGIVAMPIDEAMRLEAEGAE